MDAEEVSDDAVDIDDDVLDLLVFTLHPGEGFVHELDD